MKKLLLITVILGAILSVSASVLCFSNTDILAYKNIQGSGIIVTRTIDAPTFEAISTSRGIEVIITNDSTQKITIEADDNLINDVIVKPEGETLIIKVDQKITNLRNFHIKVTVPTNSQIRALEASSAASITANTLLQADKFTIETSSAAKIVAAIKANSCTIEASSASKIEAALNVARCSIEASSAAKIELSGSADKGIIDLSSAAKLSASKLAIVNCTIDTSSGSSASIQCTGSLTADASSGSSINYSGDCETYLDRSSGGGIRKN